MESDSSRDAWRRWWDEEGSGMRPLYGENAEQFARHMTEIAWENGAFWRRPDIDRLRAELVATKDELATKADELAAMQKQRDEALAWRPIETAPRGSGLDGPHRRDAVGYVDPPALLLASRDGVVEVGSYDWYYHPGYGNGGSLGQSPWRDHYEGREIPEVTHWMPLLQPPREKEGGGA